MKRETLQGLVFLGGLALTGADANTQNHFNALSTLVLGTAEIVSQFQERMSKIQKIAENAAEIEKMSNLAKVSSVMNMTQLALASYQMISGAKDANQMIMETLGSIQKQLQQIDEKLTRLILTTEDNFAQVKSSLNEIKRASAEIKKTSSEGVRNTNELTASARSAAAARDSALHDINDFLTNCLPSNGSLTSSAKAKCHADITSSKFTSLLTNHFNRLNDRAIGAILLDDANTPINKVNLRDSLDLLMQRNTPMDADRRLSEQPKFLVRLASEVLTHYRNDPTLSPAANRNAISVLDRSIMNLNRLTDIPNPAIWNALVTMTQAYAEKDPTSGLQAPIAILESEGQKIKAFFDSTVSSPAFHSAFRFSLATALKQLIQARNDVWDYALNSYADSRSEDRIRFHTKGDYYGRCYAAEPLDPTPNLHEINEDLAQRVLDNPNDFRDLKYFQLAKLLNKGDFSVCHLQQEWFHERYDLQISFFGNAPNQLNRAFQRDSVYGVYYFNFNFADPRRSMYEKNLAEYKKSDAYTPGGIESLIRMNQAVPAPTWMSPSGIWQGDANDKLYKFEGAMKSFARGANATPEFSNPGYYEAGTLNKIAFYLFEEFGRLLKNGLPAIDGGIYREPLFSDLSEIETSSALAQKARRFYEAVDRYLLVYQTYAAFTDIQYLLDQDNFKCARALQLNGAYATKIDMPVEPNALLQLLSKNQEHVAVKPILENFLNSTYDAETNEFTCVAPNPAFLTNNFNTLAKIKKGLSWW